MAFSYPPDVYLPRKTDPQIRFVLGIRGTRPLIVIGLNPSTADDKKADPTVRKIMGFASRAGFDGFILLNLCPVRTPFPEALPPEIDANWKRENEVVFRKIWKDFPKSPVLIAWGQSINLRPYFKVLIRDLFTDEVIKKREFLQIGAPTLAGHPRHPSRAAYEFGLLSFSMEAYKKALEA